MIRTTHSAVCSQSHNEHHTSDTTLIFMVMQPRETGPRNHRGTWKVSAVFAFRLELNSIYWKIFGGSKFSHSLTFSKKTFLQMGARISSHPFSPVITEVPYISLAYYCGSLKRPNWLYEKGYTNIVSPMLHIFTESKNNMILECKISYICSRFLLHLLPSVAILSWVNM